MKEFRKKMKKDFAMFMVMLMVIGTLQLQPGNTVVVNAEMNPGINLVYYKTKKVLMEYYNPDYGMMEGKLKFGTNKGLPITWHILGKDSGVSGDNIAIFATDNIGKKQKYSVDDNQKIFEKRFGDYVNPPTQVYANHYGASNVREDLQAMATDTNYFTKSEQVLMNATTVTTEDELNERQYETTDVLYILSGYAGDCEQLLAGSNNVMRLPISYWCTGDGFWLRTDMRNGYKYATVADPEHYFEYIHLGMTPTLLSSVNSLRGMRPATNLDVSSVMFASAADPLSADKEKSEILSSDKAMVLRFDGSQKSIGNAEYDIEQGIFWAEKSASATSPVSIVLQGEQGYKEWYYTKEIVGTETIYESDIKDSLGISSDIELDIQAIWLETTIDGLTYAKEASEQSFSTVSSLGITGIDTPVIKQELDTEAFADVLEVTDMTPEVKWLTDGNAVSGLADYNTVYTASITLSPANGWFFSDSTRVSVNGKDATSVVKNSDGTMEVYYEFDATEKDKLISVTSPKPITVANGTVYDDMNLPTEVSVLTEGKTVSSMDVTWNTEMPVSGSYDSAILSKEQVITLSGNIICPNNIDENGVVLTTSITVTINAADIVGKPNINLPVGTYTNNQMVTLSSTTDGAVIYYTTDGSIPSEKSGIRYTSPFSVSGIKGESVTTIIKAIAVKEKMQNSPVEEFVYVINLPKEIVIYGVGVEMLSDDGTASYKVTKSDAEGRTVSFVMPTNENATKISIPEEVEIGDVLYKVTAIESEAFENNRKLETVVIGNNVTKIGAKAFYGCNKLKTVTIGKKVSRIGSKAFYGCSKLKKLTIKSSQLKTKKIGSKAFSKTPKKIKITVPKKKFKTYKSMLFKRGVNKKAKFKKG